MTTATPDDRRENAALPQIDAKVLYDPETQQVEIVPQTLEVPFGEHQIVWSKDPEDPHFGDFELFPLIALNDVNPFFKVEFTPDRVTIVDLNQNLGPETVKIGYTLFVIETVSGKIVVRPADPEIHNLAGGGK